MANLQICDKCGLAIPEGEVITKVFLNDEICHEHLYITRINYGLHRWDLCYKCQKELKKFIEKGNNHV